jgi:hypothetical protein
MCSTCQATAATTINNHTIVLRPTNEAPDADTLSVHNLKLQPGSYRATFSMQGCTEEGYLAIKWPGVVNHTDSNSDSRVVGVLFGSDTMEIYRASVYLRNPGDSLSVTFYDSNNELITTLKPIVRVEIESL